MGLPTDIITMRIFLRLLLGLILLSVAVSKLVHPRRFQRGIQDYQLIATSLDAKLAFSVVLAWCISIAELVAGLGLISGFLLVPTTVLACVLFVAFSVAISVNLVRGRHDLSCHCGGALGEHRISWWLVGRNSLFIAGLVVLLVTPVDLLTVDVLVHRSSAVSSIVWTGTVVPVVLLVGVVLGMLVLVNYAHVLWRS